MPSRINGIGTTYIGKRDAQTQQGVCESCRKPGPLSNYETRLWFTVFFIPVIPLAKQQILNYCPRCTRHRALPVDQWRKVQADAISSVMAKVDANPDSPEHAVDCHATMSACGKQVEARQYAETMMQQFGKNADVLMYLGSWYERTGQAQQADECFNRALAADPKHPGALRAAAIDLAQQNRPLEAETKLAALQPGSKHFDPVVFFAVAQAYQNVKEHENALRLMKVVAEARPALAKDKKFRRAVENSEAALGRQGSLLAPIPWYQKRSIWATVLGVAAVLGVIGLDRYFASNRELFVVNGLSKPLKVRVDGGAPTEIAPNGRLKLAAGEGHHSISVVEPASLSREQEFTLPAGIIARWGGSQVNIADPTRSAMVAWEESVYSENARDRSGDFRLHVGEPFLTLDHIDYKFEEFPRSIEVDNTSKSETKHRVSLLKPDSVEMVLNHPDALTGEARLDFLESHLATDDNRDELLEYYWAAAVEEKQLPRSTSFLKKSLGERPVDIDWHRTYQAAAEWSGDQTSPPVEYEAMLAKDPDNPDLLYLRGRLEPYAASAMKYFDAALRKDPSHSYVWSAKAHSLIAAGEFEQALAAMDKAIASSRKPAKLSSTRRKVLQALGRDAQVIQEITADAERDGGPEWTKYPLVIDALAAQGKVADAELTYEKFVAAVDREMPHDPLQMKLKCHVTVLIAAKKYDELQSLAAQLPDPTGQAELNYLAHLNAGKFENAAADIAATPPMAQGLQLLCLSIGWRNAHNDQQADACLKQAIDLFAAGSTEERIVAGWLREPPADLATLLPQLADLSMDPDDKAMALLALTATNRPGHDKLTDFAKRLNTWPSAHKAFLDSMLASSH